MTKTTAKVLFVALVSVAASVAISQNNQGQNDNDQGQNNQGHNQRPVAAPEIDPGQAMGALALLGGTIAIVRGYRRKKK